MIETKYKDYRIIDEKPRRVIVDKNGKIINRKPSNEELEELKFDYIPKKVSERFWNKINIKDKEDCWNWIGCINEKGYGCFGLNSSIIKAHRFAYELTKGTQRFTSSAHL